MTSYESLFSAAASLPLADRIQLIEALWETVPEDALPPLSAEWLTEIEQRSAEFDGGLVSTTPWEDIRAAALRRLERQGE